jgi:hypothetical protein
MGTFKQGIYGGYSGKVGNVVGSSWKGINVMRIMPASVSNPQTEPQLAQRQKFGLTMNFLQPLSEFVKTGFKNYAVKKTCLNAAMGYNISNAITGAYPNFAIDYANVLVSRGSLPAALNATAAAGAAGTVVFTWEDNSDEVGAATTDKTLIVAYNAAKHQAVTVNELAERADGTQTVTVPDSWSGDQVQTYLAFIDSKGDDVASSRFAGAVTVV